VPGYVLVDLIEMLTKLMFIVVDVKILNQQVIEETVFG
jgi:hypothetical protein